MGEKITMNAFFWPKTVKTGVFGKESHINLFLHSSFSGKSAFYTFSDNPGHKLENFAKSLAKLASAA